MIIQTLDCILTDRHEEVEAWLRDKRKQAAPYVYSSVDLRHCAHKLVPVDTNLFPAGFNIISDAARYRAGSRMKDFLQERGLQGGNLLIIPENHTRNLGYLENLAVLSDIVEAAGAKVKIGSLVADAPLVLTTLSGRIIQEEPLALVNGFVETRDGFRPHLILSNNDWTGGAPALLEHIRQPVEPPVSVGWFARKKSRHFAAYNRLAQEFSKQFGIDDWLISTHVHACGEVNFADRTGLECVGKAVEEMLAAIRIKYAEYGITDEPYVFIKADSGTYGMGIMTARSAADVTDMNKKTRNKMNIIKEGTQNTEVVVQEGVPTIDRVDGKIAEPVIYLVDGVPVGGAYRVNAERDAYTNLNAQGMEFTGMCDEIESDSDKVKIAGCNFRVFGLISAIAALAAAREDAA